MFRRATLVPILSNTFMRPFIFSVLRENIVELFSAARMNGIPEYRDAREKSREFGKPRQLRSWVERREGKSRFAGGTAAENNNTDLCEIMYKPKKQERPGGGSLSPSLLGILIWPTSYLARAAKLRTARTAARENRRAK